MAPQVSKPSPAKPGSNPTPNDGVGWACIVSYHNTTPKTSRMQLLELIEGELANAEMGGSAAWARRQMAGVTDPNGHARVARKLRRGSEVRLELVRLAR